MKSIQLLPDEHILHRIYQLRGQKVMLDRDLAQLYGIETKALKQAVRRNLNRFPPDFMFEMTPGEFTKWRSQNVTSNSDNMGLRHSPFCFTELGVTMLSCILKTENAVEVNIRVVRLFAKMRELTNTYSEILQRLERLERNSGKNNSEIKQIFEVLRQLISPIHDKPARKIGYKRSEE